MRVCLVYDCLFPHTVGGAERWYRNLAERLAAEGHEVDLPDAAPVGPRRRRRRAGVRVVAVGPRMALYTESGRRRILPPLVFGAGVLWHLLRHGRRYDAVHTASFPYFSLLAAAAARPLGALPARRRLARGLDAVRTGASTSGESGGWVGWVVQRLCLRVPQRAFCFSRLHARRLREEGYRGEVTVLEGEYAGPLEPGATASRPSRSSCSPAGSSPRSACRRWCRRSPRRASELPELRAELFGDGPEHERVKRVVARGGHGRTWSTLPGFVDTETSRSALARALCMVLPSRREGYGLVVVEAASSRDPERRRRRPGQRRG